MSEGPCTFEELYAELEETVRRLEAGDLPLEESLALFERGAVLTERCNSLLDQAELRIRQLVVRGDGGVEAEAADSLGQELEDWHNRA
jgi:exodeoxyribonuclease VII small subunit